MNNLDLIIAILTIVGALTGGFAWLKNQIERHYEENNAYEEINKSLNQIKTTLRCIEHKNNDLNLEIVELKGEVKAILVKLNGRGGHYSSNG